MQFRLSVTAIVLAIAAVFVGLYTPLKWYAQEANMPYVDLTGVPFWNAVANISGYLAFGFLVAGVVLVAGLVVWHITDLVKWCFAKRKGDNGKSPSEIQYLTQSINNLIAKIEEERKDKEDKTKLTPN